MSVCREEEQEALAGEVARETAKIGTPEGIDAIYRLRDLEERWARSLLELPEEGELAAQVRDCVQRGVQLDSAQSALERLAQVVHWQGAIGSLASGQMGGLASMAELRRLQLAQSWLAAGVARAYRLHAEKLARVIEEDTNGMGKPHAAAIGEIRRFLSRQP